MRGVWGDSSGGLTHGVLQRTIHPPGRRAGAGRAPTARATTSPIDASRWRCTGASNAASTAQHSTAQPRPPGATAPKLLGVRDRMDGARGGWRGAVLGLVRRMELRAGWAPASAASSFAHARSTNAMATTMTCGSHRGQPHRHRSAHTQTHTPHPRAHKRARARTRPYHEQRQRDAEHERKDRLRRRLRRRERLEKPGVHLRVSRGYDGFRDTRGALGTPGVL